MKNNDSIIEFNRDLEPFIIQSASNRSASFNDKFKPLQFVHCADMHAVLSNWNRMIEFVNYYEKYLSFVLHTGDFCGGHQGIYTNLYERGDKCNLPILNLVGNHDTMPPKTFTGNDTGASSKAEVHKLLFNTWCESWGVTFMEGEHSMTYYRDFPQSNVRLIALDLYYDLDMQKRWLKELLLDATAKGLHVITAMHEPSADITQPIDTSFNSINAYTGKETPRFETELADFVKNGGNFIANFVGHNHHDRFGYTDGNVLNVVVECGTGEFTYWCDADRVKGTRTFDSFNVVSVDVNLGILKLIRVGNNVDNFLREKKVLCYDYVNKKIIK